MNEINKFVATGLTILGMSYGSIALAQTRASEILQEEYQRSGAENFSAARGETLWKQEFTHAKSGQKRSCTTCHGSNLRKPGKHARTGKTIEPMVPSVNPERLTDRKKIEKWFLRNCKWTLGRECTPQEKGDFLSYMGNQ
ncbi:DUF1924 domain-containing protein [Thiolapillus sp.]